MTEKYVLDVNIDYETGEEHCTVLKTDGTTNIGNWIEIVSAMYTHHSILEPLVDELNKIERLENKNEQLKSTLYYLLNVIQNKCPKYYPKCKEIVRSCFENDSTNSRNDFNNTENDGDGE